MLITDVDWNKAIGIGLFAAIYSLLMNVKGLPEVGVMPIEMTEAEAIAEIEINPEIVSIDEIEYESLEEIEDDSEEEILDEEEDEE